MSGGRSRIFGQNCCKTVGNQQNIFFGSWSFVATGNPNQGPKPVNSITGDPVYVLRTAQTVAPKLIQQLFSSALRRPYPPKYIALQYHFTSPLTVGPAAFGCAMQRPVGAPATALHRKGR